MNHFLTYGSGCYLCFDASEICTSGPALPLRCQIHTPHWQPEQVTQGHLRPDTSETNSLTFSLPPTHFASSPCRALEIFLQSIPSLIHPPPQLPSGIHHFPAESFNHLLIASTFLLTTLSLLSLHQPPKPLPTVTPENLSKMQVWRGHCTGLQRLWLRAASCPTPTSYRALCISSHLSSSPQPPHWNLQELCLHPFGGRVWSLPSLLLHYKSTMQIHRATQQQPEFSLVLRHHAFLTFSHMYFFLFFF